jgi:hypothetical protein
MHRQALRAWLLFIPGDWIYYELVSPSHDWAPRKQSHGQGNPDQPCRAGTN